MSRFPRRAALLAAWPALLTVLLAAKWPSGLWSRAPDRAAVGAIAWIVAVVQPRWSGSVVRILITSVGALVGLYASRYIKITPTPAASTHHCSRSWGRLLGVVLSDNILTLFVFWELTGFTLYLLIGFEHERAAARAAALQALIVTGAGGLALLAADVLLVNVSGTTSISAMAAQRASIVVSPFYNAIVGLVLLAAFTKSAQVPFHFWLPNAMEAPTPVSAYFHSATRVKAGV